MTGHHHRSRHGIVVAAVLSLAAGCAGTLFGRIFGTALQTSPAWFGPALLIGSLALLVVGLLLLPAAIRAARPSRDTRER